MTDAARLDRAVRRFPFLLRCARAVRAIGAYERWRPCPSVAEAIRHEYHAVAAEDARVAAFQAGGCR